MKINSKRNVVKYKGYTEFEKEIGYFKKNVHNKEETKISFQKRKRNDEVESVDFYGGNQCL